MTFDYRRAARYLNERRACYRLFHRYYLGGADQCFDILAAVPEYLKQISWPDIPPRGARKERPEDIEYDYNRLFVGPGKLLAPPYASAYLNGGGPLMQSDTIAARNFYLEAGIEVKEKNAVPDDALHLELEFSCYLLHEAARENDAKRQLGRYRKFYLEHLGRWIGLHLKEAAARAQTGACRETADAMRQFFAAESQWTT